MANNIFEGFVFPGAPTQPEPPKKANVTPPDTPLRTPSGLTETERKAYRNYCKAISELPELSKRINHANRDLEAHDEKNGTLSIQTKDIEQECSNLRKEKKNLEEELKKTKEGGNGTRMQLKEVKCDEQIASWIRREKGSAAMTETQQALLAKPCTEVCSGKVINSVEAVAQLESTFKRGNYINLLTNPPVETEAIQASILKAFPWIAGSAFVLLMIAHFAAGTTIASIVKWIIRLAMVIPAFVLGMEKSDGKSKDIVSGAIFGLVALGLCSLGNLLITKGGFVLSAISALVMACIIFVIAFFLGKHDVVKEILKDTEFCKACARIDAFKRIETQPLMNEAMYAYCYHNEIMEYFRNHAVQNWIGKLQSDIKDKDRQLKEKEAELQTIQKRLNKSDETEKRLQDQLLEALTAMEGAMSAVMAWRGQPDAVCTGNRFSDMICIEKYSKKSKRNDNLMIVKHEIEPIICYYRGDAEDSSPVDQIADQLASIVQSFTKMNSANIMQISLVDMLSGPLALSMDMRFRFVNMADLRNFANNKEDIFKGRIFKVSGAEELRELTKQLEEHCRSMQEFTASHMHQIKGGRSDIGQVNELLVAAGQEPKKYHVVAVVVPREEDRDDLGKQDLVRYLNTKNSKDFGILPVFFVNENSIHRDWKPMLDKCKRNIIRF